MPLFWINDIALTERLDSTDLHNVSRGHYRISKSAAILCLVRYSACMLSQHWLNRVR
jgi:hypothetical protein